MTTWTKIEKRAGNGRRAIGAPRVTKLVNGVARLNFPKGWMPEGTADVLSDGGGRIAFMPMGENGTYRVNTVKGGATYCSIPTPYGENIPRGTTPVTLTKDDDMWVLNLNTIGTEA